MAYTDIDKPSDYFNTVLYTGNASSPRTISGVGFSPDLVWNKCRAGGDNRLVDQVRGANKEVSSNRTLAEFSNNTDGNLTAFTSDGFTITAGSTNINNWNKNSDGYVSWNWKAGTSFTNDASSTGIGSIDSAGSVSTDAGFSIISWTGTGANATIAHGLGVAPKMIITKSRGTTNNWGIYHQSLGNTNAVFLNLTNASDAASTYWNNTSPTSSVFSVGSAAGTNPSATMIAYCFAEKQGYSKFGGYVGNGNANGTFVYTGFKPAWVMIKATDQTGEGWFMFDNKRDVDNAVDKHLTANLSNAEGSGSHGMDFVSNGIKIRNAGDGTNTNAKNYIYMAFAENPFVTSTGVPATAR